MKEILDYGKTIERLREERGLSREDLAQTSGVSYSYLSEVERGLKRPSTDVLVKIATALGMLPSDLLRRVENVSAKGRGLLRRRFFEAPAAAMHEYASSAEPAEHARPEGLVAKAVPRDIEGKERSDLSALVQQGTGIDAEGETSKVTLIRSLMDAAQALNPQDLRALVGLARRLRRS